MSEPGNTVLGGTALPTQGWSRLHPLSPVVRAGRGLIALISLAVLNLVADRGVDVGRLLADAAVVVILLTLGLVSWLVTRWQVADGALQIETGLLRRSSQRYPLTQIQAIDVVQTGVARVFGLAELRLRMAGSAQRGGGRLQSLPLAEARTVRAQLLTLTQHTPLPPDMSRPDAAAVEATEQPPASDHLLVSVRTPTLLLSVALSGMGLVLGALVVLFVVLAAINPHLAGGLLSGGAALVIALLTAFYRRLNGEFHQQVRLAPDGFRLTSGLVETTAETIPVQRVQAIRVIEPLLWRPLGWCRLEVEVAGKKVREENESQGRQRRALLPVGSRSDADRLLAALLPASVAADRRAPRAARWKAPLSYRNLGWGRDTHTVVTSGGRLRRSTHWVPLEKVQSIRRVQGPAQRALGLGTLHLDAGGRSIHAALTLRTWAELEAELAVLPALCHAAREARAVRNAAEQSGGSGRSADGMMQR